MKYLVRAADVGTLADRVQSLFSEFTREEGFALVCAYLRHDIEKDIKPGEKFFVQLSSNEFAREFEMQRLDDDCQNSNLMNIQICNSEILVRVPKNNWTERKAQRLKNLVTAPVTQLENFKGLMSGWMDEVKKTWDANKPSTRLEEAKKQWEANNPFANIDRIANDE